jgi:hypothetical protein
MEAKALSQVRQTRRFSDKTSGASHVLQRQNESIGIFRDGNGRFWETFVLPDFSLGWLLFSGYVSPSQSPPAPRPPVKDRNG